MALSVVVMEITLAVVVGFKSEITRKITGFDSQITIERPYDYTSGLQSDCISIAQISDRLPWITTDDKASLSVRLPAMIKTDNDFAGMIFAAHDQAHDFSFEKSNIVDGAFPDYTAADSENYIVISRHTAKALNMGVGGQGISVFLHRQFPENTSWPNCRNI